MSYNYKEVVPFLLDWFELNARILAWRENPRPYYVWVSEIMLQQTRVEAVKGYFDRFVAAFPDVEDLAYAKEEKLLKIWEGLGYYSRARNLQKAALMVMKEYNGQLPADYETLLSLPGIGEYTAGAISSIAYQIPVPAIDGNVLRVTKRLEGSFDDITKNSVKKALREDLLRVVPKDKPGDFNQALMELGATVCLPNGKPLCEKCPVMHLCKAFHEDNVMKIPVKPPKKERRIEPRTILLMEDQGRYAIKKRSEKGLLAGLWELPGLEDHLNINEVEERLLDMGIRPDRIEELGNAKHIFSHVEWHMLGYHVKLKDNRLTVQEYQQCHWVSVKEMLETYSIPNAFSPYTKDIIKNI